MDEVEVVVAHSRRATLCVFLKSKVRIRSRTSRVMLHR
jgi:hypothetical protein